MTIQIFGACHVLACNVSCTCMTYPFTYKVAPLFLRKKLIIMYLHGKWKENIKISCQLILQHQVISQNFGQNWIFFNFIHFPCMYMTLTSMQVNGFPDCTGHDTWHTRHKTQDMSHSRTSFPISDVAGNPSQIMNVLLELSSLPVIVKRVFQTRDKWVLKTGLCHWLHHQ